MPPIVNGAEDLAKNAPQYAKDVTSYVNDNERLRELNEKYDLTEKLKEEAAKLPSKVGDAAGLLRDVGFGLSTRSSPSITILILTAFMLGGGRRWIDAGLRYLPPEHGTAHGPRARPLRAARSATTSPAPSRRPRSPG